MHGQHNERVGSGFDRSPVKKTSCCGAELCCGADDEDGSIKDELVAGST